MPLNLHKQRIELVNLIYKVFVTNINEKIALKEFQSNKDIKHSDSFLENYCLVFSYIPLLKTVINKFLKAKWTFDRLDNIHKAILIVSAYEIMVMKLEKAISINEAMNIAKLFSTDDNYFYINSVLDQLKPALLHEAVLENNKDTKEK